MAPKQEQKWRRKLVQPVDGAGQPPVPDPPPVDGALQAPQVDQPPVPVPPPSSPAVIGSSSADRNQPLPPGAQHRLQQGSTGRYPRGRSSRGRSYHPYPSRGRGTQEQPPGSLASPPRHPLPSLHTAQQHQHQSGSPHTSQPTPPSPLHRTAQQHKSGSPHISPATSSSLRTPQRQQPATRTSQNPSSLQRPQQQQRVTRTSLDTSSSSSSSSLQTPQQQQRCCPVDGALQAPQVDQPAVPDPPPSSPAVIGSSSADQNQPSPPLPPNMSSTLSPPPGGQHQLQQGSTGRAVDHPSPSPGRGTQEPPPGRPASPHRSPRHPLPPCKQPSSISISRAHHTPRRPPSNNNSSLADSLLQILRDFTLDGEKCAFYKAEVASLTRRGSSVLIVDFEHLLTNIDLAVEVGNDNDSSHLWLRSAVRAFFNEECSEMKTDQKKEFIEGASVSFSNKPKSVFSLKDVKAKKEELVKVIKIIRGQETCRAASTFGREVYIAILIFVIGKHKVGQSWDGDFAEQDIYFFRYPGRPLECRILKSTAPNPVALSKRDGFNPKQCTAEERKKDFGTVDLLITPNYEDADGKLPVLFDDLHEDLKDSLPSTVVQEWFMENVVFDLALMPSAARKMLTVAISNLIRSLKLSSKKEYYKILKESPYPTDWRLNFRNDEGIMGGVYWYDNEERDESNDLYTDTMESVIEYEKNTHDHCHQYLEGEKRLDDFDEVELLLAIKLPKALRKLVKDLMRLNMMKGELAEVWAIYCASRSAQQEPAAAMLYVHDEVHGTQSGEP